MQVQDQLSNANSCHLSTLVLHQMAIERVILAMRERLHEPLALEDMADIAHLSPYHFSRVLHRLIGVPPGEFLGALRLDAAKRLLLYTEKPGFEKRTDQSFGPGWRWVTIAPKG